MLRDYYTVGVCLALAFLVGIAISIVVSPQGKDDSRLHQIELRGSLPLYGDS